MTEILLYLNFIKLLEAAAPTADCYLRSAHEGEVCGNLKFWFSHRCVFSYNDATDIHIKGPSVPGMGGWLSLSLLSLYLDGIENRFVKLEFVKPVFGLVFTLGLFWFLHSSLLNMGGLLKVYLGSKFEIYNK